MQRGCFVQGTRYKAQGTRTSTKVQGPRSKVQGRAESKVTRMQVGNEVSELKSFTPYFFFAIQPFFDQLRCNRFWSFDGHAQRTIPA